jgi:23S rRNA pseudouridine1911/1915/1917 synthase
VFLAEHIVDASRSFLKKVIKDGRVQVGGNVCKRPGRTLSAGEVVRACLPPPPQTELLPEDIPLDIVYEDSDVVVVNKPSGMVVHPAPGHESGTMLNALLHHCPDFQREGEDSLRPGIVHRLDRDTSGLLVAAKTAKAQQVLAQQAREHAFDRRYLALVQGEFEENTGRIAAAIGRSLSDRKKMTVVGVHGREAATQFEVLERFGKASLLALRLETGRTHQIRVHLRFAGRPVIGDPVYGVSVYKDWGLPTDAEDALNALHGQALHAARLGFTHPSGEKKMFEAPPPRDFQRALDALRAMQ